MPRDDLYWRGAGEPSEGVGGDAPANPIPTSPPIVGAAGYSGPPPTAPPPYEWRPARVLEPAPPRPLPVQDHPAIDADEAQARTLTYGIGAVVAAILLILLCALCGRTLF